MAWKSYNTGTQISTLPHHSTTVRYFPVILHFLAKTEPFFAKYNFSPLLEVFWGEDRRRARAPWYTSEAGRVPRHWFDWEKRRRRRRRREKDAFRVGRWTNWTDPPSSSTVSSNSSTKDGWIRAKVWEEGGRGGSQFRHSSAHFPAFADDRTMPNRTKNKLVH